MAKNRSFDLGEGRYGSPSDAVATGLRLVEQEAAKKLSALRAALSEGEASGKLTPFDFERFVARKRGDGQR